MGAQPGSRRSVHSGSPAEIASQKSSNGCFQKKRMKSYPSRHCRSWRAERVHTVDPVLPWPNGAADARLQREYRPIQSHSTSALCERIQLSNLRVASTIFAFGCACASAHATPKMGKSERARCGGTDGPSVTKGLVALN